MADSGDRRSASGTSQGDSYFSTRQHPRASMARTTSGQYRPTLASIRSPTSPGAPASPSGRDFTPTFSRSLSGGFSSPRQNFESSDEMFVFEFGARHLKAGLGGEKQPRCVAEFEPNSQKRPGDYSQWVPASQVQNLVKTLDYFSWGQDCELWQTDLRQQDLSLVKDKIERAVRDAIFNHLLVVDDTRKRPWIIAVPSQLPHPVMQVLITALFEYMPSPPTLSLLTIPSLCTVSAGLRSALIVDLGWRETTVTAVYEYREVLHRRSVRGMKRLHWETALLLQRHLRRTRSNEPESEAQDVSFDDSEEVLYRLIHCRPHAMTEQEVLKTGSKSATIPLPMSAAKPIVMSFSTLAEPAETAFFSPLDPAQIDDEDKPLPRLIYDALLASPADVRRTCLSHIVPTGGGANIPGLRTRICGDLQKIIDERGWDPVHNYGSAKKIFRPKTKLRAPGPVPVDTDDETEDDGGVSFVNKDEDPDSTTPAHLQPPLGDPVIMNIRSRTQNGRPGESFIAKALVDAEEQLPEVRCVETLGAWAGASLMAGLKVKGAVEIERERFLQYGLSGGPERDDDKRKSVAPGAPQRQSMIATSHVQVGQRNSGGNWSLGVFG